MKKARGLIFRKLPPMPIRTLSSLLGPGEAGFRTALSDKTRWHCPEAIETVEANALLPLLSLDRMFGSGAVPVQQLRVLVNGAEAMQSLYVDGNGLRTDALQSFLKQGATLSIADIGAIVPQIGELAAAIERDLGVRCGVNAYITIGDKAAFRPHYDGHDVLVLQCQGAKRWYSHGTTHPYPLVGAQVSAAPEPVWEAVIGAGDLLFLPRGEVHSTRPETAPSVHLTFGLTEPTGADFLTWLSGRAGEIEALRRDLGTTLTPDDRSVREKTIKAAIHELVDDASIEQFLQHQVMRREPRPVVNLARVSTLNGSACLTTALRRRVDLKGDEPGDLAVTLGSKQYRLSQAARRILALLGEQDRARLADLALATGLDAASAEFISAVDILLQSGLVATTD
ncbi:cupin domain-containing protein [Sphingomonas sp. HF-S3]|uniref:Cupin domain-containing protein n=1 Tax=Sphingomonas rustica TaxID=3103142 RepID=A0ABV0B5P8_9SPHN